MGDTSLSQWYSWNYGGTEAGHHILQLSHSLTSGIHTWTLGGDYSRSLDRDEWQWSDDDGSYSGYRHYFASWTGALSVAEVTVSAETTSLNTEDSDAAVILSIQRSFGF